MSPSEGFFTATAHSEDALIFPENLFIEHRLNDLFNTLGRKIYKYGQTIQPGEPLVRADSALL